MRMRIECRLQKGEKMNKEEKASATSFLIRSSFFVDPLVNPAPKKRLYSLNLSYSTAFSPLECPPFQISFSFFAAQFPTASRGLHAPLTKERVYTRLFVALPLPDFFLPFPSLSITALSYSVVRLTSPEMSPAAARGQPWSAILGRLAGDRDVHGRGRLELNAVFPQT